MRDSGKSLLSASLDITAATAAAAGTKDEKEEEKEEEEEEEEMEEEGEEWVFQRNAPRNISAANIKEIREVTLL